MLVKYSSSLNSLAHREEKPRVSHCRLANLHIDLCTKIKAAMYVLVIVQHLTTMTFNKVPLIKAICGTTTRRDTRGAIWLCTLLPFVCTLLNL